MIVPSGMTEAETFSTLDKVCKRLAAKYQFGIYDKDDIYQEAIIIAMSGLEHSYTPGRPLENFMAVHVNNRLKNLKRDKYMRPEPTFSSAEEEHDWRLKYQSKQNLNDALSIDHVRDDSESSMWSKVDFVNDYEVKEIFEQIDQKLPIDMRADFLRMRQGVSVPKARRNQIEDTILGIMESIGYE